MMISKLGGQGPIFSPGGSTLQ